MEEISFFQNILLLMDLSIATVVIFQYGIKRSRGSQFAIAVMLLMDFILKNAQKNYIL